jgi:hypothetical protein
MEQHLPRLFLVLLLALQAAVLKENLKAEKQAT